MSGYNYTTNLGDYLVIWITGMTSLYIAEVTGVDPLRMKVEESGPFAHLKTGDFIIREEYTEKLQKDCHEGGSSFLQELKVSGTKIISGLKSIGVESGKLHEILPPA